MQHVIRMPLIIYTTDPTRATMLLNFLKNKFIVDRDIHLINYFYHDNPNLKFVKYTKEAA